MEIPQTLLTIAPLLTMRFHLTLFTNVENEKMHFHWKNKNKLCKSCSNMQRVNLLKLFFYYSLNETKK